MIDKNKKVEKQNRLRKWRRQNCEEAKEIGVQANKSSKWKGLKTICNPFTSY
jgi:hypothetical protein